MTTQDPFKKFLNIPETASAEELLDVDTSSLDSVQIEEALHKRLAIVFNHPQGRTEDAEQVRQRLRDAAQELKLLMSRRTMPGESGVAARTAAKTRRGRSEPTILKLTAFDRLVLSVLVGCGGWNARCRARLVAAAANYGVSVQGLLRVVKGLGEYARSGGPPLGVNDIAATTAMTSSAPGAAFGKPLLDRAAENLAIELRRGGPWMTIRMAALFAGLTLLAAIVGLRLVLVSDRHQVEDRAAKLAREVETPTQTRTAGPKQRSSASISGPKSRIATFPSVPTFLGNGLPSEAVAAEAQCSGLAAQIDELARKLSIADEPSEAVYRHWDASIELIGAAWVLVDQSTRREIERAIFEALRESADTPTVSDRLLKSIMPANSIAQPLDVWRGSWLAGTLGTIAVSKTLPPVVVERARVQLEMTIEQEFSPDIGFEFAARNWLDRQLPQLVESIEFDDKAFDTWELWLSAQRALGRDDRYDQSLLIAMEMVLSTGTDLSRPGPSCNVLGRLVSLLLDHPGPRTAQGVQAFFNSENISSHDLWVFTSLLAMNDKATWFPDSLVIPDDADQRHRWRVRDDLAAVWPNNQPSGNQTPALATDAGIDRDLADQWSALANNLLAEPMEPQPEKLMERIIRCSRLIAIAEAIENRSDDQARWIMGDLDVLTATTQPDRPRTRTVPVSAPSNTPPTTQPRVGQPIGRDGEWAAAYQQAGRNAEQRLEMLRSLRNTAGTDLGLIDADRFVQELYRGSPPDIRLVAQSLLIELFSAAPNVSMELLDQLATAPVTDALSVTIQDLCGETLPAIRETEWPVHARLALVRHALGLRPDAAAADLDALNDLLIESYVERLRMMRREAVASAAPSNPQEGAKLIAQAWSERAALAPTPAPSHGEPLSALQRRTVTRMHLAEGPIQVFAVHQLSILDLLSYTTIAEQPSLLEPVTTLLDESLRQRVRLENSLEQCAHIEQTIVKMWQLRFGVAQTASAAPPEKLP